MITFIKILEYKLKPVDVNLYDYISKVASMEIDPPTLKKEGLSIDTNIVLHSPLKRSIDCIRKNINTEYVPMNELRETPFDLKKMCNEEMWNKHGSKIVRKKFKEMFITDTLLIPRGKIFDEIKVVLQKCKEENQNITIVSHSFRMKIIEAYITTKGELEVKPELIENFIKDKEKTYEFGKEFEAKIF